MKKLLLVLMVVALAAFLLVGCIPSTPVEGESEGEVVEICPTVAVTTQVAVGTKTYIKAGSQTITVTFAVPTEPVSVYVGYDLKTIIDVWPGYEVAMYANADKTVYTGTFTFGKSSQFEDCSESYIYVGTCETCAYCKTAFVVDGVGPESEITIKAAACAVCPEAGFCDLTFKTPTLCDVCCGDGCSGFASYTIDLYTVKPFDECCDISCATVYKTATGTTCPVDKTIRVAGATVAGTPKTYYVVATLLDLLGNRTRYYATVAVDSPCTTYAVKEYAEVAGCSTYTGTPIGVDTTIGLCLP